MRAMKVILLRLLLALLVTSVGILGLGVGLQLSSPQRRFLNLKGCLEAVKLGEDGLWEGPWTNASVRGEPGVSRPQKRRWEWLGVSTGVFPRPELLMNIVTKEGDLSEETVKPVSEVTAGLSKGQFDISNPLTVAFSRLLDSHMSHWTKIEGVKNGLGKRGVIKMKMFAAMAVNEKLLPCTVHIRIMKGRVFFRYGPFLDSKIKLIRANQGVKMIQDAIIDYNMQGLNTELFLNVCDQPMSFDNSLSPGKSGFPVFSTRVAEGVTDIPIPDPLDLNFVPPQRVSISTTQWRKMVNMAVHRGQSSNFEIKSSNYGSSPRFRLHHMSDVRPDLLDARITMWGPTDQDLTKESLIRDGFYLAPELDDDAMSQYKYRLVVDDAVGTTGMCEGLSGQQVVLRQQSPFMQFFDLLLLPGVHFVPVEHSFRNLFAIIEWMKKHDPLMRSVVSMANEIAPLLCSWKSRTLYWAIALSKYAELAMEDLKPQIEMPTICNGSAITQPAPLGQNCKISGMECGNFCTKKVPPKTWTWLSAEVLKDVPRTDPLDFLGSF